MFCQAVRIARRLDLEQLGQGFERVTQKNNAGRFGGDIVGAAHRDAYVSPRPAPAHRSDRRRPWRR
jgi:hypothetical protein